MRKIISLAFLSLDGVMQAPGNPTEDTSGDFTLGGWCFPYWDEVLDKTMGEQMGRPFDMLLGRKTYDIFEEAWPKIDAESIINKCKKYVVTNNPIKPETPIWKNSIRIDGNVAEKIKKIKEESGPEIQVHGSTNLLQTLLKHNLIDELWLKIYPVVIGKGKKLFGEGSIPAAFQLIESTVSTSGVIIANYRLAGQVQTGSFSPD
ncbi:dihydrofolate reductase family protein [Leptospira neocaledonica]|uniref:Riboflavin biosynthesis protein RibD n=1 Tax=Leptospira neocaledonica TaxID=2023192 RepID=A0A2M9ZX31_9LEPT|nr:dihydrofolate reductase family protein [Leptospira neocaledonica]PJZ76561.1 riboflavin biosynthesis protein RibD [Leptospira neocaledonica]